MEPVTCPSCGSKYNPETRELVEDTGLQARIRELEVASEIVRNASADLRTELDETKATLAEKESQLAILNAPEPQARDFIVGSM